MRDRLFTPRTATDALDALRPAVREMRRLARAMNRMRAAAGSPEEPVRRPYFRLLLRLDGVRDAIRDAGAVARDPSGGTIDFPARLGGRRVWLCWRAGEPEVGWWREEDAPPARRRRVASDASWESGEA